MTLTANLTLAGNAPGSTRSRRQRLIPPVATVGGLAIATLALHLRDPHGQGSWGFCPSAALGVWCPGCGGLRAVNDLTNGDLVAAASSNLLFVCSIPLVVFLLARWGYAAWRGDPPAPSWLTSTPVIYAGIGLALAFTVARNLPWFGWLAP